MQGVTTGLGLSVNHYVHRLIWLCPATPNRGMRICEQTLGGTEGETGTLTKARLSQNWSLTCPKEHNATLDKSREEEGAVKERTSQHILALTSHHSRQCVCWT